MRAGVDAIGIRGQCRLDRLVGKIGLVPWMRLTGIRANDPMGQCLGRSGIWPSDTRPLGRMGRSPDGGSRLAAAVMVLIVDGGQGRPGEEHSCRSCRKCVWRGRWSQWRERRPARCGIVSSAGSGALADACRSRKSSKACSRARFQLSSRQCGPRHAGYRQHRASRCPPTRRRGR